MNTVQDRYRKIVYFQYLSHTNAIYIHICAIEGHCPLWDLCGHCHVPVGQNCWKHEVTLVTESHEVKIMKVYLTYPYLGTRKLSRKRHIHITTSGPASGINGRRKVPHLSASTNGIREQKADS